MTLNNPPNSCGYCSGACVNQGDSCGGPGCGSCSSGGGSGGPTKPPPSGPGEPTGRTVQYQVKEKRRGGSIRRRRR